MEPETRVYFSMSITLNNDLESICDELEKLSLDLHISSLYAPEGTMVKALGYTTQKTYENLFSTTLGYENGWKANSPEQIPENYKGKILSITTREPTSQEQMIFESEQQRLALRFTEEPKD